jgi:hypothetical protein
VIRSIQSYESVSIAQAIMRSCRDIGGGNLLSEKDRRAGAPKYEPQAAVKSDNCELNIAVIEEKELLSGQWIRPSNHPLCAEVRNQSVADLSCSGRDV